MKKINIVKDNRDFNRIIKNNKPFKYHSFILYIERKNDEVYKFGFSTPKKIGSAVTRNRIRRQLKSIVDKNKYYDNFNCIIIVGKGILNIDYNQMRNDLNFALNKLGLIKEK